jgi:putative transposase
MPILAHKIRLNPNNIQKTYMIQACGVARKAYNWGLEEWNNNHAKGLSTTALGLLRELNKIKKIQFPWMKNVTKAAPQYAILNLGQAFNRFFKKQSQYPRFKRKGVHDSFRADTGPGTFKVENNYIKLPKIGKIRMFEALRFNGKMLSATISRKAEFWFVSILVKLPESYNRATHNNHGIAGIDLGITHLATISTGEIILKPPSLSLELKKLARLNRQFSRKKKGSNNKLKALNKLRNQHYRIFCLRTDCLHKLTKNLTSTYAILGIEDLNVRGMLANRSFAPAISSLGFYEFRRQLTYKAALTGTTIVIANRFYPSSKTCSNCGEIHEEFKRDKIFICPTCAYAAHRDINAALNLQNLAASSAVTACGVSSSGVIRSSIRKPTKTKLKTRKQETNTKGLR